MMSEINWAARMNLFYYLDFFVIGCLIALLFHEKKVPKLSQGFGWVIALMSITPLLPSFERFMLMNVGLGMILLARVSATKAPKRRIVLELFGKYSYGLFLSHIMFFWFLSIPLLNKVNIENPLIRFITGSIFALCIAFASSWLSYNTAEKYFQNATFKKTSIGVSALLLTCIFLALQI
jgi:peptidoglycan/LPS O-acetylase OafA/YrhL